MSNVKKIHCNLCNHYTNHKFVANHIQEFTEADENGDHMFYEKVNYNLWVCLGCDSGVLEEEYTCSGMRDFDGSQVYDYTYHPPRKNKARIEREVKGFKHLDPKLNAIYHEIISSNNSGLEIICSMGIRALLEGICVKEGINDKKSWGLDGKLKKLKDLSHIPESIFEALTSIKFIGDNAAHQLIATTKPELELGIDVLEALLTHLYEAKFDLLTKAEKLKKKSN